MADPAKQPTENDPLAEDAAAASPSLLTKLRLPAFVTGVVLLECVIAYSMLPSVSEGEGQANAMLIDEDEDDDSVPRVEVDLEQYSITSRQPGSSTALRIDFHLWGTIVGDNQEEFDERMAKCQHRFREQVIESVRSANLEDLTDPGLGAIKRVILDRANRVLGKPILRDIIVSEFSFVEQ
ncbi:MAG: hypothetical protein HQ581_22830 [Planctomycetes bacterium]|nr:hypothetical protein [Planctomycetota bacterium]